MISKDWFFKDPTIQKTKKKQNRIGMFLIP